MADELRWLKAAKVDPTNLTSYEASELDTLIFRAHADLPFGPEDQARMLALMELAGRPPVDESDFNEILYMSPPLGGEQLALPLEEHPDRVMVREIGDRNVRELAMEMFEDIEHGPTEYERTYLLDGENYIALPKRRGRAQWTRVTIVPECHRERLFVECWYRRPRIEALFDPSRSER